MSLFPSNGISELTTGRTPFPNVAGLGKRDPKQVDQILTSELDLAGIPAICLPESSRERCGGEPQSIVIGELYGWSFERAWYYWVAKGPGIPPEDAVVLHADHGTSVRVAGHCGCPSPLDYYKGFAVPDYHVDNQEGLNALAATIRRIYSRRYAPTAYSKLRAAVAAAGFSILETSGDWSIHDTSELGRLREAKELEIVNRNVELEVEVERLKKLVCEWCSDGEPLDPTGRYHVGPDWTEECEAWDSGD